MFINKKSCLLKKAIGPLCYEAEADLFSSDIYLFKQFQACHPEE